MVSGNAHLTNYECVKYSSSLEDAQKNFQETIFRDAIKKDYCEKNGINILYISYKQLNDIEKILSDYFRDFKIKYDSDLNA